MFGTTANGNDASQKSGGKEERSLLTRSVQCFRLQRTSYAH